MSRIVIGGAGFIGSHLVERLGNNVKILDSLSTGRKSNLEGLTRNRNVLFKKCDIVRTSLISQIEKNSVVFHVAASSDVKESMINPKKYFENNTVATMNILEAMRKKDATKIIFTSSSVVYGISNKINFENSQKDPISVYGLTKLMCEDAIKTYCNAYGFNGIILRLANIVGKRAPKGIIHDMVTKFKKNPNEIEVLGDGNQTKSYLHVSDCVNAIVACYKHMNHQKNACEIYNVANSDHIRVKYIVRCIANEMSIPKFKIKYVRHNNAGAGWHGDLTTSKLSISKLKRLSWAPKHSCESAIRLTVKQILQKS